MAAFQPFACQIKERKASLAFEAFDLEACEGICRLADALPAEERKRNVEAGETIFCIAICSSSRHVLF